MPSVELSAIYRSEEWPHGLRCALCSRSFSDGDAYSERLYAFVDEAPIVEIACLDCAKARVPKKRFRS